MKSKLKLLLIGLTITVLSGCGSKVEVPPAHVGKISTKDGYQDNLIPTSKFRLDPCFAYCDRLVLLDVSDRANTEKLKIFIPTDKLELEVDVRTTLSLSPKRTESLFGTLSPQPTNDGSVSKIAWEDIYRTYAQQIIQTEAREYLSQFSIAEIASSLEKVNADLRIMLQKVLSERTPFDVRYVGITNIRYPEIISMAQENAAQRREQIQQEEAQLEISKVILERELQEARLQRQIDKERAETEAEAQQIQREVVDSRVLELRRLENQRLWIEKWSGVLPTTVVGGEESVMLLKDMK